MQDPDNTHHKPEQHHDHYIDDHLNFSNPIQQPPQRILIKVPPMTAPNLRRRSGRQRTGSLGTHSMPSGSEYHESDRSMDAEGVLDDEVVPEDDAPEVQYATTSRGRKIVKKVYRESASEDDMGGADDLFKDEEDVDAGFKRSRYHHDDDDDEDSAGQTKRGTRSKSKRSGLNGFIVSDDDGQPGVGRYQMRSRKKKTPPPQKTSSGRVTRAPPVYQTGAAERAGRLMKRKQRAQKEEGDVYVDQPSSGDDDADGSLADAVRTSDDADGEGEVVQEQEVEGEGDADGRYAFRQRAKVNYTIPPPIEEMVRPPKGKSGGGRAGGGRNGWGGGGRKGGPGWSASGAELSRWMGMAADDSDSDNYNTRTPRKGFNAAAGGVGGVFGSALGAGGMMPSDLAAVSGTPSNLGKIGDSALADADPLGVNTNVTFDEVGGLDDHIHSLKEMTLLPLLYPEVFQRFSVTPPRGVLFHGPPGTGKTLLARALAASCRSNGKQISFFMRKGADCLSKWVGEAERQLRLLFEEARSCQPSIIFFDEIDGLAPVRSSKQDQIHASIVSTLLALMDGMDGRGQVIVIGATNRPDAVDPALRRPGRFDREFYFGLPGMDARKRILEIMTKEWEGWKGEEGKEKIKGLAKLTKGYGGADLRALCTEAALNAVQRRYPQIYKSNDRLLLKPETIDVGLRDFMISIKKLVPSSARSTTSAATQLPPQFVPLLADTLEQVKQVISTVLPVDKKRTALEEAEYEDDDEVGALEREMMLQSMETLRVHRPRVVVHGSMGMGQGYIGAAALHHLEGFHVQSLELGGLLGDSTRTVESAIVQLFVEAKRHQPSVIYIPSLVGWCAAVSETSRSTVRAMLDTLAPTDPILLLAIVDGPFSSLPRDVRAWFGPTRDNRIQVTRPNSKQREDFFDGLLKDIQRPPNQFADGVKRRKRILEELPIAPPIEPRKPSAAELALQEENDHRVITLLRYRLGPIMAELKRKFKRFTKRATDEYVFEPMQLQVEAVTQAVDVQTVSNGVIEIVEEERMAVEPVVNGPIDGDSMDAGLQQQQMQQMEARGPPLFDMDLERMHKDLYKDKYLTPQDFLDDVGKIVHNAEIRRDEDPDRLYKAQAMFTAAEVSIQDFDPTLRLECDRMATRERQRREERKKNKGKGKAADSNGQNGALATRRSARHIGQAPELCITDPLQLERRLKRQRSDEEAAASQGSGDENSESRTVKKSKVVLSDDDDHDPLDVVGPTSSQPRPQAVRFAPNVEPMEPLLRSTLPNGYDPSPEQMVVDPTPQRNHGFDQSLLNPMPASDDVFSAPPVNGMKDIIPGPSTSTGQFLAAMDMVRNYNIPAFTPPHSNQPSPPRTPVPTLHPQPPAFEKQPSPVPIVIERSPTPPHPDFHVDDMLLSSLKYDLRETTQSLTVEQLEQLRATCLGCTWRHRSDWDRDNLVREVKGFVKEFVGEVATDDIDEAVSPEHRW